MSYENIKITMLGYTGTGKTCYMISMYAFMKLGINGFTFSEVDLDRDLELTEMWEALIDKGKWPDPNPDNVIEYTFDFNYAFQPIMSFDWLDYRGGALADSPKKEDVQKLIERVKSSSCLFLCISAEHLQIREKMKRDRAIKASKMNVLMTEIGKALKPNEKRPFPVVFVITKFDQYPNPENSQEVVDTLKELFPTFWESPGWLVSICPVSLGRDLKKDAQTEQFTGEIDPVNVHIPVAFAIYCKLYEQKIQQQIKHQELKKEESELSDKLQNLQRRNVFVRIWKGEEIDNTVSSIERKKEQMEKFSQELDEISQKLSLLSREMMQSCFVYLNGQEKTLDV